MKAAVMHYIIFQQSMKNVISILETTITEYRKIKIKLEKLT